MIEAVVADSRLTARPTIAEIDLAALRHNLRQVRAAAGRAHIFATVKANAYGHGLLRCARELLTAGADSLAVAFVEEGIALRRAGIDAPILVLGGIPDGQIEHFIEHDLQLPASSLMKLRLVDETAAKMGKQARVHLKIDTGMGRIGVRPETAPKLFEAAVNADHCELCGVFSHFANSGSSEPTFCREQFQRFQDVLGWFPAHGRPLPLRHIANSGAILQHPETVLDGVRPGIMLYGVYPEEDCARDWPLQPVMTLKTRVVYFKVVRPGTPLGYDSLWTAPEQTRIVTLPVGYADGYPRALSDCGVVLIHGRRYPLRGRISMDQCVADIGQGTAYNNDEVVLFGRQGETALPVEEVAGLARTIPYEILAGIAARVPRIYIDGGRVVDRG